MAACRLPCDSPSADPGLGATRPSDWPPLGCGATPGPLIRDLARRGRLTGLRSVAAQNPAPLSRLWRGKATGPAAGRCSATLCTLMGVSAKQGHPNGRLSVTTPDPARKSGLGCSLVTGLPAARSGARWWWAGEALGAVRWPDRPLTGSRARQRGAAGVRSGPGRSPVAPAVSGRTGFPFAAPRHQNSAATARPERLRAAPATRRRSRNTTPCRGCGL